MSSRGMIYIHSAPRAFRAHVEWSIGRAIGEPVPLEWAAQPVLKNGLRTEYAWEGPVGLGATLASALHSWPQMRFEVTEDASPGVDGARWMFTPDQGMHVAQTDAAGNVVLPENRIMAAVDDALGSPHAIAERIELLLGRTWDEELDVFRHASDDNRVVWLHGVG